MSDKPKSGEWWKTGWATRCFVIGNDFRGDIVVQYIDKSLQTIRASANFQAWSRIEGCTGFDWVEQDRSNAGLLEALVNLRDNMDRLNKRVEKLEQASIPFQTIGGSALR